MKNDWIEIHKRIINSVKIHNHPTTHDVSKDVKLHDVTTKKHLEVLEFWHIIEREKRGRINYWKLK